MKLTKPAVVVTSVQSEESAQAEIRIHESAAVSYVKKLHEDYARKTAAAEKAEAEKKAAERALANNTMPYEQLVDLCFPDNVEFPDNRIIYGCLALAGESGEVIEKVKKLSRDNNGVISAYDHTAIIKELGDVLWAVTAIANGLGSNLAEVLAVSRQKFLGRMERGTLHGSGDDR